MRGLRLGLGLSRLLGSAAIPYSAYAFALDFDDPQYWVGGTQYTPVTTLPGYSFTRSGQQGAVDASGAVQYFAANVAAINSAGYHAYGALTNLTLQSQTFDNASWTKQDCTVGANNVVAPDGTTTADTLTATGVLAQAYQTFAGGANTYTTSMFIPAGGTAPHAYIQINTSVGIQFVTINRTTGAVGAVQLVSGAALTMTAYSVAIGTGWRLVLVWVETGTAGFVVGGISDAANSRASTVGITCPLWQHQTIVGNFPDGGPIIVTAAATASIGASALATTTNPYTADADFIVWGVVDFKSPNTASNDTIFQLGANILAHRDAANVIKLFGPDLITSGVTVTGGRAIILIRRRAGKWTILCKKAGGVATLSIDTVVAFPLTTTALTISAAAGPLEGKNEGLFARTGTFSDVDITAIADAAVT